MNVLEVGGSGFVGKLINPYLKRRHRVIVFDLVPPEDSSVEYIKGSVLCQEDLQRAMSGVEAVIYLAMGRANDGGNDNLVSSYDVNVRGVHQCLEAAAAAGVRRAVYASTLSIYSHRFWQSEPLESEEVRGDATTVYGFTKRLGEEVCEFFARAHGMTCLALRLCAPTTDEKWENTPNADLHGQTKASDLARAFDAALTCEAQGFVPIFITGDASETICKLRRARELLGWEPTRKSPAAG